MRNVALAAMLVLLASCGRTGGPGRDSGARDLGIAQDARDADSDPPAQPSSPEDSAPDRSADLPEPDVRIADVGDPDAGRDVPAAPDEPPVRCPPLANDGVLNLGYIKQALFAADGKSLLVRMGAADSDAKDDARLIQLPGGESRVLWSGVRDVEWLGSARALFTTNANELVATDLDGSSVRTSTGPACSHVATPNGLRVYFTSSGCDHIQGPLAVLDVATGTITKLAPSISTSSLVVSPDSRWAAYVVGSAATGPLNVVDAAGTITEVPEVSSGLRPTFANGRALIFQTPDGAAIGRYDLEDHDMQGLAEGDVGIAGYELTTDGSALLVAKYGNVAIGHSGELYRVTTDGGAPFRLATDLMDYRMYSMVVRAFAFAPTSKRVLYLADRSSDGGRANGVSSVPFDGGEPIQLSADSAEAVLSSHADRVALVAVDRTRGRSTLSVVSAGGDRQFAVEVTGNVGFAGFVPGDRGLLYVQTRTDLVLPSRSELTHLSFTSGKVTRLGVWQKSSLALSHYPIGISTHEYPADPHGCYTVVDSDMDATAARLVALPD